MASDRFARSMYPRDRDDRTSPAHRVLRARLAPHVALQTVAINEVRERLAAAGHDDAARIAEAYAVECQRKIDALAMEAGHA